MRRGGSRSVDHSLPTGPPRRIRGDSSSSSRSSLGIVAAAQMKRNKRARQGGFLEGINNGQMFNPTGDGQALWNGATTTRTKASRTLFVTRLPQVPEAVEQLRKAFEKLDGFKALRTVRRMVFCDFDDVRQSTAAMRAMQNHKLPGATRGIAIDFDKDPTSKRNANWEKQRHTLMMEQFEATHASHFCACCGTQCMRLVNKRKLGTFKQRSTDKSWVVNELKYIRDLRMAEGAVKLIRREKGIERQYRLVCTDCGVPLAYRPVPLASPSKYTYFLDGAVVSEVVPSKSRDGKGAAAKDDTTRVPTISKPPQPPPPAVAAAMQGKETTKNEKGGRGNGVSGEAGGASSAATTR